MSKLPSHPLSFPKSMQLFERAARVIPGGIYGHTTPNLTVPGAFPYYADRAEGCRYWDVDGREYIDYMCGYGPIVLGYNHPEVEEAARKQNEKGNCFNHPTDVMVELAEYLVEQVDFADWAVFGKNGSDMTNWSIQVAREKTGRKKILTIAGAYHGIAPWCTPGHGGLIEEDRAHIHSFTWNDPESFDQQIRKFKGEIAGVIVTPYHHPVYRDSVLPAPGFMEHIEKICRRDGIILILDDVRAGFRLHLGGSHRLFNFTPDLICFCKAIGNGHPLSAALGTRELLKAAGDVFLTGSYWNSAVPMAAALATLKILERDNGIEHMAKMGIMLMRGLEEKALKQGLQVSLSGPPALPFLTFRNDMSLYRNQLFGAEASRRGLFLHPHHNWFVCVAHQEKDILETLEKAEESFAAVKEQFGS